MAKRSTQLLALAAVVLLVAGAVRVATTQSPSDDEKPTSPTTTARSIGPDDDAVLAAERARRRSGATVREMGLTAAPASVDLGGRTVETWAFNGTVPGPEIRLRQGDVLRAVVSNDLPEPLTVHWHGIALRNDMDGVPDLTQEAIAPGATFTYEFTVPDAGTYFYHPHTGTQLDRGLYGALIVEDDVSPPEGDAAGVTVLLDDWLDGLGDDPDEVLARLTAGDGAGHDMGSMGDMEMDDMGMASPGRPLGSDTSDVDYPLYLVNGQSRPELAVRPGTTRLRLINAGSDTPFRVAVVGSRLTVVATDGFPVRPVTVDTLVIGMGERYDVLVEIPEGSGSPLIATAEGGDGGGAQALLRSGPATIPEPASRPAELNGDLLTLEDLVATEEVRLGTETPDRTFEISMRGDMQAYRWALDAPAEDGTSMAVREGERIRLVLRNDTMMWHPIHLHGHTFQVSADGEPRSRKDTAIVPPMETVVVEFDADNPGAWALHCHNIYHAESGMVTAVSYVR
jgi:FtsP/CotA-like multicopper oxidase with cupredoxin domain